MDFLSQRGEAKLLTEDWEGAVADLKLAAEKSPQVQFPFLSLYIFIVTQMCSFCCLDECVQSESYKP